MHYLFPQNYSAVRTETMASKRKSAGPARVDEAKRAQLSWNMLDVAQQSQQSVEPSTSLNQPGSSQNGPESCFNEPGSELGGSCGSLILIPDDDVSLLEEQANEKAFTVPRQVKVKGGNEKKELYAINQQVRELIGKYEQLRKLRRLEVFNVMFI